MLCCVACELHVVSVCHVRGGASTWLLLSESCLAVPSSLYLPEQPRSSSLFSSAPPQEASARSCAQPPTGQSASLVSLSSLSSSSCASSFSGPASFLCASWQATPGSWEFRLSSKPFAPLWRAPPLTGREQLEWIAGKGGGCSCRDAGVLPEENGACAGQAAPLRKGMGPEEPLIDNGAHLLPSFPLSQSVVREGGTLGDFYGDLQLSTLWNKYFCF